MADDRASHPLAPLLAPRSIALVGASARPGTVGHGMVRSVRASGFAGPVHLINPNRTEIEGMACLPSLAALPAAPELVAVAVGGERAVALCDEALAIGARALVLFDGCYGAAEDGETFVKKLRNRIGESGIPLCGGNGMGFFDVAKGCHVSFYEADHLRPGGITLIAQSGSVFTVLALNDHRYRFNLVISAGQEIATSIDQYMDYALERPDTKVIAIFMEAARRPAGFAAALAKAQDRGVPVVVCKVGRTPESARLALSHSGAIAGDDAAFGALLARHGALRVETVDQLMNAALLLSQGRPLGAGGLGAVTDSGGLRESLIDRAAACGVSFAPLSENSRAELRAALPEMLDPTNPVDAAGPLVGDFHAVFRDCLEILAAAPEVAALGYEFDGRDDYIYGPELFEVAVKLPEITGKPCFAYNSFANANNRALADRLADAGVPLLNGQDEMLAAVRNLFAWWRLRQACREDDPLPPAPGDDLVAKWRERLTQGDPLSEAEGLNLLDDFGVATVPRAAAADWAETAAAAERLGYPLVLKTAVTGIAHKTEAGGVRVGLRNADELEAAYRDMAARLGPEVLLQQMAPRGVELAFGCVVDPDFGPLVLVGAGGTLVEVLDDHVHAMAPFGPRQAQRLLARLKMRPLLDGVRGQAGAEMASLCESLSRFSLLCHRLGPQLSEADVNPMIAGPGGCVAVDALVVPRLQP